MLANYKAYETEDFINHVERLITDRQEKTIRQITFQVTENCCLRCTYCYQHNKSNNKMSWEIAKQLIDDLLYDKYDYINSSNTLGIILDFIGGEPFMEIELIGQIVEYTYNTMIELNHPWLYYSVVSLCSNGVLYTTPKVQSFFKKYGYLCHLSISLDGNKELHDSCRIDLDGKGSYDKVIEAVKLYREQTGGEAPTKMTLSPSNISYLSQAVLNLINENYKEIHLNYAYEPGWTIEHAKILYNELKIITHYIIDNNLYNKIYISLFDEDLGQPMAEDDNANWCGGTTQGGHITIDYCGRIFPCLRYMNSSLNNRQKPICIGEVGKGILLTEEEKENFKKIDNITRRSQSTDECFYCPIAQGCGWCSAYNYEEFGTANKRATYICIMHQARSLANVYYWNTLYQKLNINKKLNIYLPKNKVLQILNLYEYNYLKQL